MSGDYSRIAFDPALDDLGVLWEQGRPVTDRDCNDFVLQSTRRIQAGTLDTIGPEAVPEETKDAFKIEVSGGTLTIARGRMYVDGLLAENHGAVPSGGTLTWDPRLAELFGTEALDYMKQPYDPDPPDLPTSNGVHLVYLDVWQREVTYLMRDGLVDTAIGVDTSTRLQTVWQVKILADVGTGVDCSTPLDQFPGWLPQNAFSAGRLTSDTAEVPGQTDPCQVPPQSGYKGQENQLYRVEIHKGGGPGTATFKWSRDNASVETQVTGIPSLTQILVESVGRDDVLRFSDGDWIEITDDWLELHNQPGLLRHIKVVGGVDDVSRIITFDTALPAGQFPVDAQNLTDPSRHTRIRRWDQKGKILDASGTEIQDLDTTLPDPTMGIVVPTTNTVQVLLEQGIVVSFDVQPTGGEFRSGDWWVFAARAGEGTIEKLSDAAPRGIHHHYAHLGLWDQSSGDVDDCRVHWPCECGGCCTVTVAPGENIQSAIDSLGTTGGCVCLKTGVHQIEAPIMVLASRIIIHGESPGAVVHSPSATMLIVGDPKIAVSDVAIEDIRFEAGPAPSGSNAPAIITCANATRLRIERCQLAGTPTAFPQAAATLVDVTSLVCRGNRAEGVAYGVLLDGFAERIDLSGNEFAGAVSSSLGGPSTLGFAGVMLDNAQVASCHVEENVIRDFAIGVYLGQEAEDCVVARNTILRKPIELQAAVPSGLTALRAYLDDRTYAIDVQGARCEVRGNRIDLRSASWGGVRAGAPHVAIADNLLEASISEVQGAPLPASIYCFADNTGVSTAHDADVTGNRLVGPQVGIVISRVADAEVANNRVQGEGGWFGVVADDCTSAAIRANALSDVFYGVFLGQGDRNQFVGNEVENTIVGIAADTESDLQITGNRLYNCALIGAALMVRGSSGFLHNRVARSAYGAGLGLGVLAIDPELTPPAAAMLRLNDCELTDIGIAPNGTPAAGAVWALMAWVSSCQIETNHIGYTTLPPKLAASEHRALVLAGPIVFTTGSSILRSGSALVTGNHFRGPGLSGLVDVVAIPISQTVGFMFERVTFSNNVCEHWNAQVSHTSATVQLHGAFPIVMGNQVKADPGIPSILLGNPAHGTIMGNVATGTYIQLGGAVPTPVANFNVVL